MILPKQRDPRLVTIRRGGTLTDSDHHLLALWAALCAEHVLHLFEAARPDDRRPRYAIEMARAWTRGQVTMTEARTSAGHANGAARDLRGAPRHAAYAAAQAAAVAHVAAHDLGAAAYAIKAARAASPPDESESAGRLECLWQRDQLPEEIRELVLDDQRRRNDICWFVFRLLSSREILRTQMDYRMLGRSDVRVSIIGLGCGGFGGIGSAASLFGQGENEQQAFALMDRAVELGVNYFDTADSYGGGRSEEMIGRWMRDRGTRDGIVLATKVFNPMAGDPNSGGLSRRHIMRAIDSSLKRLQTDRIDIYLAHEVDPTVDLEETMRAFDDLVRSGKVNHLGFCNIEPWRVVKSLWMSERIGGARLACIQNEYNLLHRKAEKEMLPVLASEAVSFVAFSPMAGGWLSGKYRQGDAPPAGSRMTLRPEPYGSFQNDATYRAIDRFGSVAADYGTSPAALALAWAAAHPHVTSILAGPRNAEQFRSVEDALRLRLDDADRMRIADLAFGEIQDRSMSSA